MVVMADIVSRPHADHAGWQQESSNLEGPQPRDGRDDLVEEFAREARLHQVPVAEQHAVADRSDEGGTDQGAQQRDNGVPAGVEGC
jgi:hypothetical protein